MTTYEELTTRIRREMNGAVSGSMRILSTCSQRKINFGVSLPTIKNICLEYSKDHNLALQLREHNVREWWIAAAFVDDPTKYTIREADKLLDKLINMEESDIYATALLHMVANSLALAISWLKSDSAIKINAAEKIIMKLSSSISDSDAENILRLTTSEIPVTSIYRTHYNLRWAIREKGPYTYSWILDEIDNL